MHLSIVTSFLCIFINSNLININIRKIMKLARVDQKKVKVFFKDIFYIKDSNIKTIQEISGWCKCLTLLLEYIVRNAFDIDISYVSFTYYIANKLFKLKA